MNIYNLKLKKVQSITPPKIKILKAKSNKIYHRSACEKLQNTDERCKEDLNKSHNISCSCMERFNLEKILVLPN